MERFKMKKSVSLVAETVDLLNEVIVTDIGGRRVILPITLTGDEEASGGEHPVEKYFSDLGLGLVRPPVVEKLPTQKRIEPVKTNSKSSKEDEEKKKKYGSFLNSANSFLERIADKPGLASLVEDMQPILSKLAIFAVQNPIDADDAFLQIRNDTKKMKAVLRLHKSGEPNVPKNSLLAWPEDIKDIVLIPGPRGGGIGKGEIATCMMYRGARPSVDGASPTATYDIEDGDGKMSVKYSQPLGKELKVNNVEKTLREKLSAKDGRLTFKGEINKGTFDALTMRFNDEERSKAAQHINDAVRELYDGDPSLTYLFTSKDSYIRVPTNDPRIKFYGTTQGKVAINFDIKSWIDAYDKRTTTSSSSPQSPPTGVPKLDSRGLPEVPRLPLPESRRRKTRRSEASMGGVPGVAVPMGRGPDGKPDRRSGEEILRRNGKNQARYFGGGSIVEETRELLLDLLDD